MKLKRGFTLIEVIVVIGIIGVLTVIVFPAINNIRAKNRDAERVADIATIQLGLILYKNQSPTGQYPVSLNGGDFSPKYVPADSLVGPDGIPYLYVPLTRNGINCTAYHLGVILELPNAQIDAADQFNSKIEPGLGKTYSGGYTYCPGYTPTSLPAGIDGSSTGNPKMYDVHP